MRWKQYEKRRRDHCTHCTTGSSSSTDRLMLMLDVGAISFFLTLSLHLSFSLFRNISLLRSRCPYRKAAAVPLDQTLLCILCITVSTISLAYIFRKSRSLHSATDTFIKQEKQQAKQKIIIKKEPSLPANWKLWATRQTLNCPFNKVISKIKITYVRYENSYCISRQYCETNYIHSWQSRTSLGPRTLWDYLKK